MKKLLFILFLLSTILGCNEKASLETVLVDPYPQLTSENVLGNCQSTETWTIRVMPMPVAVVRYGTGCAEVEDLLVFVTPTDRFTEEQRDLTVKLAVLYYVGYLEREKEVDGKKWNTEAIKQEKTEQQEIFYFKVTSIEVKAK